MNKLKDFLLDIGTLVIMVPAIVVLSIILGVIEYFTSLKYSRDF